ncbi:HAMP domain-containing protein [Ginsengibacter hankyongi]|uniref:histidine kinase n=1 Tax=Ginsengibacter hankyongi TaxID=2607284 RepID=A0A5J5IDQ4_9BACT|nr:ATP-binding protein [Ginsengibacter hankyongi]KAA9036365.1 HAMP domain-containing protein [Ginsengibacter hankyongi]
MQVFTSVIVLGLCFAAFVLSHIRDYKERKVASLSGIAQVIATNSVSTLQFQDNEAANDILYDLKKISPEIINAAILDQEGRVFASYVKAGADSFQFSPPKSASQTNEFRNRELLIFNPITYNNEMLGTVCLHASLSEMDAFESFQYRLSFMLLIVGVALSFLIAFVVQRYISKRILNLVGVMKEVSETGNYKMQVQDDYKDEINTLTRVFNEMMDQINISLQKKDEFIGIASHELKTPLTSIKAYLQVLDSIEQTEPNRQYVKKTLDNVNRLQQLIYDLLDVSKIQSGQMHLNVTKFNVDDLIDDTIASFRFVARDHTIIRSGEKINQLITADRQRLEQVLVNLLSNATKYSPNGKKIIIYTGKRGGQLIISVRDFGIGIPKEEQGKVFERFYRAKKNSILISGFGLGLYICKDIIKRHKGKIWIEGEDKGTSFYVSLPLDKEG